ncbi:MAG: hypothetical protein KF855_03980 [Acidobacteria bacterium]|nr:hypothetical protein [Acidobacteriota bacterium]
MSKRRKIGVTFIILFTAYVGSYWVIRELNAVVHERDGCPTRGCEEVSFPSERPYAIYSPLYQLDKFSNPGATFQLGRK